MRTGTILVSDKPKGGIEFVGQTPGGADVIDCAGRIVTPSFAIAHHHIYSALARGMPAPPRPPENFLEILQLIWWRLDKALDIDMVRACAQAVAIDALRSGVTFIIDHHASPNCAEGSLHAIAEVLDGAGLGHLLCYELSDRDGPDRRDAGLRETGAYLESHQGLVGLHASFTVSTALLTAAVEMAREFGTGLHIHVAEDEIDQEFCQDNHNCRVVERLHAAGVLEPTETVLAHCIHLDDDERAIIADSAAWVSQQSESNQNNAVGALDAGAFPDRTMIGTDGMHSDALGAARAAFLMAQREEGGMSPRAAYDRLRAVHEYLASNGFEGDAGNNLVILDYNPPTPITAENWPAHLMYGVSRAHVESVIAGGRLALDRGRCTLIDEESALANCREQAARLWEKL
ncbi:MAG: amidohydrolase family protein [Phycisphaeraceae bacterium]|nr:amidohydrolase family protein [Phycisphaeraceae bacterium]MCB9847315.1 amidohydrolase family protein [Phycisphaeraceae bacterium]